MSCGAGVFVPELSRLPSFAFERLAKLPHLIVFACESLNKCGVMGGCCRAAAFEFVFQFGAIDEPEGEGAEDKTQAQQRQGKEKRNARNLPLGEHFVLYAL